jgi:hypothetical protein
MLHVNQPPGGRFPERWHASAAVRENLRDLNGWAMLAVDVIGKHRAGSGLPSLGSRSADPSRDPLSTITISRAGQFTILRSDHAFRRCPRKRRRAMAGPARAWRLTVTGCGRAIRPGPNGPNGREEKT